jgi:murein L,D-transpeptidase YcbB/YkuD
MPPGARCALAALLMLAAPGAARAAPAAEAALAQALRASLAAPVVACSESRLDPRPLAAYYQPASPRPLWVSRRGPGARARALLAALRDAGQQGLDPARYRLRDIEAHWRDRSPAGQACLDLYLTHAFKRYSLDLRTGQVGPFEADPSWYLPLPRFDPAAALKAADGDGGFNALIEGLAPSHPAYQRLREALARYEGIAKEGGWPTLPPGPDLAPGVAVERDQLALLRARLRAEGDLVRFSPRDGATYDAALADAVRRFQQRHGLRDDAIVGPRTRAALNVPVAARIAQIRRALERWRWLPHDLGERYILVNIPGFELTVIERGRAVLGMRAILGALEQPTPSFAAQLRALVINPYWNVPARIAREELLPLQRRDPRYFAAHGFKVLDLRSGEEVDPARIDWTHVDTESFAFRLRQEPGPKNSLGRLSFVLPNPFEIFLHDTPEKALFARATRTFSHGCIRIEHPVALAQYVLRGLDGWDEARLRGEIDSRQQTTLNLPEPIPVYVLYLTSWVDDAGRVNFRDDVYGRDNVLAGYYPDR